MEKIRVKQVLENFYECVLLYVCTFVRMLFSPWTPFWNSDSVFKLGLPFETPIPNSDSVFKLGLYFQTRTPFWNSHSILELPFETWTRLSNFELWTWCLEITYEMWRSCLAEASANPVPICLATILAILGPSKERFPVTVLRRSRLHVWQAH